MVITIKGQWYRGTATLSNEMLQGSSKGHNYTTEADKAPSPCWRRVLTTVTSDTKVYKHSENTRQITDAPSSLRADVWQHFGFLISSCANGKKETDKSKTICKYWRTKIRYTTGYTSNLRSHLVHQHSEKLWLKAVHCGGKWWISEVSKKTRAKERLFVALNHTVLPALCQEAEAEVTQSLKEAKRIPFTADGWTSRATQTCITVTAHVMSSIWEMKSFVLQTESHAGLNIAEVSKCPGIVTVTDKAKDTPNSY